MDGQGNTLGNHADDTDAAHFFVSSGKENHKGVGKNSNENCIAKVLSSVKGGLIAEIEGLRGFIPSSQLRTGAPSEMQVGQEIEVKILEADPKRNKLILSQRQVYTQQREMVADEIISRLAKTNNTGMIIDNFKELNEELNDMGILTQGGVVRADYFRERVYM